MATSRRLRTSVALALISASVAGCSRAVRTGALIDRYRSAPCIPTTVALDDPLTRSWDHHVRVSDGLDVRISGMQMPGGRIDVEYSPGGQHDIAANAGDYIYPADVRIDPATQHMYVKASGTPAVPIGGPQTWLFDYDLRARRHAGELRVDPAVLPAECPALLPSDAYVIASSGVGPIRLGMTLDEVRRALPYSTVKRTTDGDGAALVEVRFPSDRGSPVLVSADEDDPHAPIDWSKKIVTIETFNSRFHTAEGVHAGSSVTDVEKVYGKAGKILKSEIESRQYITFERQPVFLTFRVEGGKVHSIAVSSR